MSSAARVAIVGVRGIYPLKPANTAEAVIFTAGAKGPTTVVGIIISNNTAGAVAATVRYSKSGADWDVYVAKSIPANDSLIEPLFIPLPESGTVKVTSATGNALTFSLVVVEYGGALGAEHGA